MKKLIMTVLLAVMLAAGMAAQEPDYSIIAFNHQICVGMPWQMALNALGRPAWFDTYQSEYGLTEWWYYPNGVLVVIRHGAVSGIGTWNR